MRRHFQLALRNISRFGDTDVLPYPIENHIFFDRSDDAIVLLDAIHRDFYGYLDRYPPFHESSLTTTGYFGFRWATQIDPLWNAYLLALVIVIGSDIERERLPAADGSVFSYRFKPDPKEGSLFDREFSWEKYQLASLELADRHQQVLLCDISDFYARVYHHRLENNLYDATSNSEYVKRIMKLLSNLSPRSTSYGLPVGGPAARLLSELLLNSVDTLLVTAGIPFCRFADDYHLFADTQEQAYRHLLFLSEKLYENQGLTLQKAKTRLMSAAEFRATSAFARDRKPASEEEAAEWGFLNLKVHFDPYEPAAAAAYQKLKKELAKHDVLGMLARELQKSRPSPHLTRRLLEAMKYLEPRYHNEAVKTLLENLEVLYPVLSQVLLLLKKVIETLDGRTREEVFATLRQLITTDSHLTGIPAHLAFAVRVLAHDPSNAADKALVHAFNSSWSLVRRDTILAMARRARRHWIRDLLARYRNLGQWEQRALLIASYVLGEDGDHWRERLAHQLWPLDKLAKRWAGEKKGAGTWEIPL